MAEPHLSIGEVLNLLQEDFPDVTISKIRFLESQGLIDPERTPSGYRKFYEGDIARLRWILVQQRENFLPLKVIKDRLEAADGIPEDVPATEGGGADLATDGADPAPGADGAQEAGEHAPAAVVAAEAPFEPEQEPHPQPIWMADLARSSRPSKVVGSAALDSGPSEVSLTARELAGSAGITLEFLRELEQYGLVVGRPMGDDTYYDGDALLIARKAAAFYSHGIGARHLRMFKVAAEREAGFLEQVAMPMLKQRNPDARKQAVALVEELADLGHDLRAALLRANLRQHLGRS